MRPDVSGDSGFEASDEDCVSAAFRSRVTGLIGCHPCVTTTVTPDPLYLYLSILLKRIE
jgi:hypothetical protein